MLVQELIDGYDMNLGRLHGYFKIVPLSEDTFDPSKEDYTLRLKITYAGYESLYTYRVTNLDSGKMPALVLNGYGATDYPCPYSFAWWGLSYHFSFGQGSNVQNQNVKLELMTSQGDTAELPGINDGIREFYSTVMDTGKTAPSDAYVEIDADFPIFGGPLTVLSETSAVTMWQWSDLATYRGYVNEIVYNNDFTNIDLALNAHDSQPQEINEDKVYFIKNALRVNGSIVAATRKDYQFKIDKYSKIGLYTSLPHENDKSTNMVLKIKGSKPFKYRSENSPTWTTATSLPSGAVDYYYNANNRWTDFGTGDICYANLSTNIKIFSSEEALDEYFETGNANDAINGGDDDGGKESDIGGKLESTDIPTTTPGLSGTGTYVYALSLANLKTIISDCLYVTDNTVVEALKEGLWLWGNNPIDFMVDLYYIPFSLSSFYTLGSAGVKFGTYTFPSAGTFPIVTDAAGTRVTLFNTFFSPIYGDWRDYAYVSYDLYLPFIGFVPIDVSKYLGHNVKCEMMFDVTTHNMRYYLYSDGIVTDRFDGSVGVNMPIMSSDQVNKAKMDIQNAKDTINSGISVVGSLAEGKIGGAISGIIDTAQSMASVVGQKTPQSVVGGFSSSMNIYDIKYAYLRISENKHYYPGNLNSVYNYPSYYIGPLSALSGYCELEDVQLKSSCTENEYNEIKQLLKEGVIFQ